jgi:ketosteroid isomerase-like protein
MASVLQEILEVENAMVREFNAGDVQSVLAHFHPRVIGFSSTQQERVSGLGAMKRTFDYYHQASAQMKYRIGEPRVQLFGDTAIATFYWTVELGKGRPRHLIKGRGSHVLRHEDGKWLIVHEHFSRAH